VHPDWYRSEAGVTDAAPPGISSKAGRIGAAGARFLALVHLGQMISRTFLASLGDCASIILWLIARRRVDVAE